MRVRGNSSDDEEEDEGDDELDEEGLRRADPDTGDGGDAGVDTVMDHLAHEEAGGGGAEHLRCHVRDEVRRREVAEDGHGDADCRVHVAPGYMDEGNDEHRDGQTHRHGDAHQALHLVHDHDGGHLGEHQDEGPQELRHHLKKKARSKHVYIIILVNYLNKCTHSVRKIRGNR